MSLRVGLLAAGVCFSLSVLAFYNGPERHCPEEKGYPTSWWEVISRDDAPGWEILPQDAKCGEVILSKRKQLGQFSNLAPIGFELEGKKYASVEGLWQMMKYPEGPSDERRADETIKWPYSRDEVAKLSGFEAKRAGDIANANMAKLGIKWVTYNGKKIEYRGADAVEHLQIIQGAMRAKVFQNPDLTNLLKRTGRLILRPDHRIDSKSPPAYWYDQIYMSIRAELLDSLN